ncbi:MAG TPA: AraC family transcriptional regulator, partial [Burkholderiales bacterium]|nr:AraC family transcriptional regulator [Burkholderiales bacterium]
MQTPAMTSNARIFAWGTRALYLGPVFNLSAHRVGVAAFCCGVSGEMEVARDPRRPDKGFVACRSLLIPAGALHLVRFNAPPLACLYLDPQSDDVQKAAAAMRRNTHALATAHSSEKEIIGLLDAAARNKLAPDRLHQQLTALLDLAGPLQRDERVARVVARMRDAPGAAHPLAALARDVGLSESRLQHLFKTCTGVPLRRFRIWNRMGTAIGMAAAGAS